MKNSFKLILCFALVIATINMNAQQASLGEAEKLIDIPVDMFTGISQYSIPLATVSDGTLQVSASLTYASSGNRPSELTVPLGEGWVLNNGYTLTRQVMGVPDEVATGNLNGYPAILGCTSINCDIAIRNQIASGEIDGEPDVFSYALGNYAGKFYLDTSGTVVHITHSDVKIIFHGININNFIGSFTFFTPEGIENQFIVSEVSPLISLYHGNFNYTTSWVIDKIISFDQKDTIFFEYTTSNYSTVDVLNDTSIFPTVPIDNAIFYEGGYKLLTKIKGRHTELNLITSPSGIYSNPNFPGTSALRYDEIQFKNGNFCYAYSLEFEDLFSSPGNETGIRLTQVKKHNCIEVTMSENPYSFEYYNDLGADFRPSGANRGIDHWSYYNAATNTKILPVVCQGSTCIGSADRSPSLNATRQGILQKVTNPNLLETTFDYELNSITSDLTSFDTITYLEHCTPYDGYTPQGSCQGFITSNGPLFSLNPSQINGAKMTICMKPDTLGIGNFLGAYDIFVRIKNSVGTILHTISLNPANVDETCLTINFNDILDGSNMPVILAGQTYSLEMSTMNSKGRLLATTWTNSIGDLPVGGLRLKKITHSDGNPAHTLTEQYAYEGGVLYRFPQYLFQLPGVAVVNNKGFTSLVGANAYHIGYTKVTKSGGKPGHTVYNYNVVPITPTESVLAPDQIKVGMGDLLSTETFDHNGISIAKDSFEFTYTLGQSGFAVAGFDVAGVKGVNYYNIHTGISRPMRILNYYKNIFTSQTLLQYGHNYTLQPSLSTMITASGDTTSNYFAYTTATWFGTEINNRMAAKNLLLPFVKVQLEKGTDIRGAITNYDYYAQNGSFVGGSGQSDPTTIVRPSSIEDYKYNPLGTSSIIPNGWQIEKQYHSFTDEGLVANEQNSGGWLAKSYTYQQKRNTTSTYGSHIQKTSYKTGSTLVDTVYQIDGTAIVHQFDGLMRLKAKKYLPSNVEVLYDYHFATGPGDHHYVRETITYPFTDIRSAVSQIISTDYFDRFGRSIETVHTKASPALKDVIQASDYDNYNRKNRTYLPVESTYDDGRFVTIDSAFVHSITSFESSALSRPIAVLPADWHSTSMDYDLNNANDDVVGYAINLLYKETVTDGNGNKTITFTDFKGRKILDRKTDAADTPAQRQDTYYKFDLKDRLVMVIPPGATADSMQLITTYGYDAEDKLLDRKLPQAASIEYVYNARDLQISTRDGHLTTKGKWLVSNFDDYGRLTSQGFTSSAPAGNGPYVLAEVLSEYSYGTAGIGLDKMTISKQKILGSANTFIRQDYSYDSQGRLLATTGNSLIDTTQASIFTLMALDNVGNAYQSSTSAHGYSLISEQWYDGRGRVKKGELAITGLASLDATLYELEYNYRNEVTTLYQGKTAFNDYRQFLQKIDYSYRVNGLLQAINQALTSSTQLLSTCANPVDTTEVINDYLKKDLYFQKIGYDSVEPGLGSTARNNGEIAADIWQVKGRKREAYGHSYDAFGRLLQSTHYEDVSGFTQSNRYGQGQSYDKRGNINNMRRRGFNGDECTPATIDSLQYVYNSNQLVQVMDKAPCPQEITLPELIDFDATFEAGVRIIIDSTYVSCGSELHLIAGQEIRIDHVLHIPANCGQQVEVSEGGCGSPTYFTGGFNQTSQSDNYLYDSDGNMKRDPNKKVTMHYNHLRLLDSIVHDNGDKVVHLYDASGTLHRRLVIRNGDTSEVRTFVGSTEWLDDSLAIVNHSQGQWIKNGSGFDQQFFIMDHLGNTRLVYQDKNGDGIIQAEDEVLQENHYYPFGMKQNGRKFGKERTNEYFYNGIRREDALGLNFDMTFYRSMDATIGRWHQQDPRMEEVIDHSPYVGFNNNPVSVVDPEGDIGRYLGSLLINFVLQGIFNKNNIGGGFGVLSEPGGGFGGQDWVGDFDRIGKRTQIVWDDWVQRANGEIYWDPDAKSQETTKAGEMYLGYGFATVNETGLQTNYRSDGIFDHYSSNENVLPEALVIGMNNKGGKDFVSTSSDVVGGLGEGMQSQGGSFRVNSGAANGYVFSPKYYESGWYGGSRARISTYQFGATGKILGKLGTAGTIVVGGIDIASSAYHEKNFGTYTQRAVGRTAGSLIGGAAGAKTGAAIGVWFWGWGAIPGGIIGGVIGSYGGSQLGDEGVKFIQR